MCLGIPAKILETGDGVALVELGGVRREISVMLIDNACVGEWVIIHAGFAIERLSEEEAEQTLALFRQIAESEPSPN